MTRIFSRVAAIATSAAVAAVIAAGGVSAADAATGGPGVQHAGPRAATQIRPEKIRLTPTELARWRRETATPAERAKLVAAFRKAFAGVAQVSTVAPDKASLVGQAKPTISNLAMGRTGDHFWIIASYADVADGAIWGAVAACGAYAPEFFEVCDLAGDVMSEWAQGWGRASNHGVWTAIYWWPPHVTGGRW
jgi:hypothetical protein